MPTPSNCLLPASVYTKGDRWVTLTLARPTLPSSLGQCVQSGRRMVLSHTRSGACGGLWSRNLPGYLDISFKICTWVKGEGEDHAW